MKFDAVKTELITKLDEIMGKAIEEKNVRALSSLFRELHHLYRDFSDS
jgi:hypothetical protein